jgi:outer membrane protein OmpA-like peptidoglycan-associated protein
MQALVLPVSATPELPNGPITKAGLHVLVIDYYGLASDEDRNEFKEVVNSYLSMYIERCADIEDDAVQLKKSKKETLRDINSIVTGALTFYDYQQLQDFQGFSIMVEDKLSAIDRIDFRKAKLASGGSANSEKRSIQEFYLKQELDDLKLLINIELGMFSGNNLMVKTSSDRTVVDDETKQELLKQYTGSEKNTPLGPIKVKISPESMALINFKDTSSLDTDAAAPRVEQPDLMERVLQLLEQNTSKLDQMQIQIDQMRVEQIQLWQQQQDAKNVALQSQIDELKGMIVSGAIPRIESSNPDSNAGMVLNFPKQVELFYANGATTLDASSQLALNEIVDLLARQPKVKVIISGYADKSGNSATNLLISQKRANGVKTFFTKSGLNGDRFITKYHGDTHANGEGNNRRVTVEFIQP